MNRKQRRAALKQSQSVGMQPGTAAVDAVGELFAKAAWHQHHGQLDEAARLFKRLLSLNPDYAEACNDLGCVLLAQGKLNEASAQFARAMMLVPQLFDQFLGIAVTLQAVNPALTEGMRRAASAWPQRLPARDLLGPSGLAAISDDPMLRCVLESTTIRDIDLEHLLTSIRLEILQAARALDRTDRVKEGVLGFYCALASQCFINEYVFAETQEESEHVTLLKDALVAAAASGLRIAPLSLVALAMYFPLHSLPNAQALLDRSWPAPVAEVLTQQVREPEQERQSRDSVPRLTAIDDDVSLLVKQQYEENPYPRWVHVASAPKPIMIDKYLRQQFPTAAFHPLGKSRDVDILVAGCGTGRHPIEVAQMFMGARVLAVDLSLTSLCYAKRKTPPSLAHAIEYAQADLLKLGSIGRSFDLIEAMGVLHHLSDPMAGWRSLLSLLRPGGLMRLGLYSAIARREVVAARAFIAEQGFRPTADDIRRCRQALLESHLSDIGKIGDFFGTSDCRDLLFHVQESQLTLPEIKSFIAANDLKFIGFEFGPDTLRRYRSLFAEAGWSTADLDRWHVYETENPKTFSGMYQFWIQKN
jgi:2-polyprenyl-3-methyl-5-hydroxy-6-metoxy-1,4-benzoquinol methylase